MATRKAPARRSTAKKTAGKVAKKATTKPAKKAPAKSVRKATKKMPSKVAKKVVKKAASKATAPKQATKATAKSAKKAPPSRSAPKKVAKKSAARNPARPITPRKALANTLALLEAKNERAKQPPAYPGGGDPHDHGHAPDLTASEQVPQVVTPVSPESAGHSFGRGNQGKRSQS